MNDEAKGSKTELDPKDAAVLAVVVAQPEPRTADELVGLYQTQYRSVPGAKKLGEQAIRDSLDALRKGGKLKYGDAVSDAKDAPKVIEVTKEAAAA